MATDISIRRASLGDLEAVVALNGGLFTDDAARWDPAVNLLWAVEYGEIYFAAALEDEFYACFLAETGTDPVGYLLGLRIDESPLRPVRIAEIESMYVARNYRGLGVGTRLARAFQEWARDQGAERLQVTAYAANARAISFYRRLGFDAWKLTLELKPPPGV